MGVIDIVGKKFGRLTVLQRVENDKYGNAFWLCKCECGNTTKVQGHSLRSGHCKSCGCLQKEKAREIAWESGFICKGRKPWNKGKDIVPEKKKRICRILYAMTQRCCNPHNAEYKHYGGRGITICKEWRYNPEAFYEWAIKNGYDNNLTIERIDNNKGYSPQNCKFATREEQNKNTSRVHRIIDESSGKTLTAADAARIVGVDRSSVAKWCREEGIKTLSQVSRRAEQITGVNYYKTKRAAMMA